MLSISRRPIIVLSLIITFLLTCILLRFRYINTIPEAPIYGNSVLVSNYLYNTEGVFYPYKLLGYTSSDNPEKIIQFYSQTGTCKPNDKIDGEFICKGNANPFGEYTVAIDTAKFPLEHQTSYILEIEWEKGSLLTINVTRLA